MELAIEERAEKAQDFGIGWRQVAVCFLMLAAVSMITTGYGVMAGPLGTAFHASRTILMLAMTIVSGGTALLSPVLGALMDRTSVRRLMVAGAVMLAAGYGAISFATSFVQVLIIFALFIAPTNVLIGPVAATVLLSRWFVKRRGIAIGVAISGIGMGGIIFPPLIQWLFDHHSWQDAFRILALILLAYLIPAAALVVNSPAEKGLSPDGTTEAVAIRHPQTQQVSTRAILADPTFWLAAAIFSVVMSGMMGVITNLVPLAIDSGIKASKAAWLVSIYAGGAFAAKLGFASVADRVSPRTLLCISIGGFGCGIALLTQYDAGFGLIAISAVMIGFFGAITVPMQSYLVPRIFGEHVVGKAMGLITSVTVCALLVTPPLFGLMFDLFGSYRGIFLVFTALAAGAMLIVRHLRLGPGAPNQG